MPQKATLAGAQLESLSSILDDSPESQAKHIATYNRARDMAFRNRISQEIAKQLRTQIPDTNDPRLAREILLDATLPELTENAVGALEHVLEPITAALDDDFGRADRWVRRMLLRLELDPIKWEPRSHEGAGPGLSHHLLDKALAVTNGFLPKFVPEPLHDWLRNQVATFEAIERERIDAYFLELNDDYQLQKAKILKSTTTGDNEHREVSARQQAAPAPKVIRRGGAGLVADSWKDIGIGITPDWSYFAITPCPNHGDKFPKEKATRLSLRGKRWKSLLELYGKSQNGRTAKREEYIASIGAPGGHRPDIEELRDADLTERCRLRSRVADTIRDLNKDLKKELCQAGGSVNSTTPPMSARDKTEIRAQFTVRNLCQDPDGQLRFGEVMP